MAVLALHVPGVYYEPQPRAVATPIARTDIAGFIGFDPRVRNGTHGSEITALPAGHAFRVDIAAFQLTIGNVRALVPATIDFVLSEGAGSPIAIGESIVYAVVVRQVSGSFVLAAVAGTPAVSDREQPPTDADVRTVLGVPATDTTWSRISNVTIRRAAAAVFVTAQPTAPLAITVCDDYRDYVLNLGEPPDDGTLLGPAVRTFFANGGRRCWVATLRRPDFDDAAGLTRVRQDMVGVQGSSELLATGLERLLLLPEVTIVDAPDLYATRVDRTTRTIPLPPSEREACFLPCTGIPPKGTATTNTRTPAWAPIFESFPPFDGTSPALNDVFDTQARLLTRCIRERWRVLLVLSVPRLPDGGSGPYIAPTDRDASAWRRQFDLAVKGAPGAPSLGDTTDLSCAALYWPWVLTQTRVDDPVIEMSPSAHAVAVMARRDLARGPHVSAANETLRDVVGVAAVFGDDIHGALYDPPPDAGGFAVPAVNVVRAFPGYGIQVWGARTLSTDPWLRFLSVRRTLTAIELRLNAALLPLVFEPNTPGLWLHVTQTAFAVLLPLFESGALRGSRPEEAFYVRCDGRVNPPDAVARGELLVEVGVAVAAPAEFIVFRVGRRDGVIEVLEP
jgi:uncharacterized protein